MAGLLEQFQPTSTSFASLENRHKVPRDSSCISSGLNQRAFKLFESDQTNALVVGCPPRRLGEAAAGEQRIAGLPAGLDLGHELASLNQVH